MEPGSGSDQSRIALELQYDGTAYNGWQSQSGGRTVQGEIEKALRTFLRRDIGITASGRTDSGVHAVGQVAHFDAGRDINLRRLCAGLNGILRRDASVINAFRVTLDFHARFGAVRREYRYLIHNHHARSPFLEGRALWVRERLDVGYLREVAGFLVGEMDFSAFCKKKDSVRRNTVRKLDTVDVGRDGNSVAIDVAGNAFLHHMVRILVGTMLAMHRAQADPRSVAAIIAGRDRDAAGATAPPHGLYLMKVTYRPPLDTYESAF